jgi:uncharacterized repeat protein (TIGR01451 family)
MHNRTAPTPARRTLLRWIAGAALTAVLGIVPGVGAAETTTPQLKIAVDNGQQSATSGDQLDYTITVANLASAKVRELVITQTVPAGATFVSADTRGVRRADKVTWKLDLNKGRKIVVHASMTAATPPEDLLRLATVACAQLSTTDPPLVCATDSDQLPAGAVAESAQQAAEQPGASSPSRVWWYVGGAVALAGVAAASLIAVQARFAAHQRRRRTRSG